MSCPPEEAPRVLFPRSPQVPVVLEITIGVVSVILGLLALVDGFREIPRLRLCEFSREHSEEISLSALLCEREGEGLKLTVAEIWHGRQNMAVPLICRRR